MEHLFCTCSWCHCFSGPSVCIPTLAFHIIPSICVALLKVVKVSILLRWVSRTSKSDLMIIVNWVALKAAPKQKLLFSKLVSVTVSSDFSKIKSFPLYMKLQNFYICSLDISDVTMKNCFSQAIDVIR